MIPSDLYKTIVDLMPILCVDIVLKYNGKYLLVKRTKEPLKDQWWVPGGRVLKGETITDAARRKIKEELGVEAEILKVLGYFEDKFRENEFGLESGIHTVSIVFLVKPLSLDFKLDNQSSSWKFVNALPEHFIIKSFLTGAN